MLDDSAAQSQRSLTGDKLEKVCLRILNSLLNPHDIAVLKGSRAALSQFFKSDAIAQQIVDFNKLPVKRPCDQKQLEDYPDTDLFVLYFRPPQWRVLGLISCKVSFHSRHTMVTFWGLAVRISSNIPYICVTEDANVYGTPKRSELGSSCQNSTAARRLLESFTDGIYIIKPYTSDTDLTLDNDLRHFSETFVPDVPRTNNPIFDSPQVSGHTRYCESVRPFDDLVQEILSWRRKYDKNVP